MHRPKSTQLLIHKLTKKLINLCSSFLSYCILPRYSLISIGNANMREFGWCWSKAHSLTQICVLKESAILTPAVKLMWKLLQIHSSVPFWVPQAQCIWRGMCTVPILLKPVIQVCGFLAWFYYFLENLTEILTASLSDMALQLKRLQCWPKNSFSGSLWAQLHKEKGLLPLFSSHRRVLWAEPR